MLVFVSLILSSYMYKNNFYTKYCLLNTVYMMQLRGFFLFKKEEYIFLSKTEGKIIYIASESMQVLMMGNDEEHKWFPFSHSKTSTCKLMLKAIGL